MKQFWVDFSASMLVNAETEEDAKKLFLQNQPNGLDFVEVQGVERIYTDSDDD